MTATLFLAVVLSCAGDPAPGTLNVPPPPPPQAAVVEKVADGKLDTLEPDVQRPRRPRPEPQRRILLEMLVVALELVINH